MTAEGDFIVNNKLFTNLMQRLKSYRVFPFRLWMAFKYCHMMTMDKISDISTFGDLGSIFKFTAGFNV